MHSSTRRICLAAGPSHAGDAAPTFLPVSHFLLPFLPAQGYSYAAQFADRHGLQGSNGQAR